MISYGTQSSPLGSLLALRRPLRPLSNGRYEFSLLVAVPPVCRLQGTRNAISAVP